MTRTCFRLILPKNFHHGKEYSSTETLRLSLYEEGVLPRCICHYEEHFASGTCGLGLHEEAIRISSENLGIRRMLYLLRSLVSAGLRFFNIRLILSIIFRYKTSFADSNLQSSMWSLSAAINSSFGSPSTAELLPTIYELCIISETSSSSKSYVGLTTDLKGFVGFDSHTLTI